MVYQALVSRLWQQYVRITPQARAIQDMFMSADVGEKNILNDHIAFRAWGVPPVDMKTIAYPFQLMGYELRGEYNFEEKQLNAAHFELPGYGLQAPKVFISELKIEKFSPYVQSVAEKCAAAVSAVVPKSYSSADAEKNTLKDDGDTANAANLSVSGHSGLHSNESNPAVVAKRGEEIASHAAPFLTIGAEKWQPLSYYTYEKLLKESEYAAWLYAFGICANHFTVLVNSLENPSLKGNLKNVNALLKSHGFTLNSAGGEIKGSAKVLLEQSSTLAAQIPVEFSEGTYTLPSCYYEFAQRYPIPSETNNSGQLYSGFVTSSADKIFESTNKQT